MSRHGAITIRGATDMPYVAISSSAFYETALRCCEDGKNVHLWLGTTATDTTGHAGAWAVETSRGRLTTRTLIDARPPRIPPNYGQFFRGVEIHTDRARFDPTTVGLMHFRPPHAGGIDFVYVLPFASDRALVEVTRFGSARPSSEWLKTWLAEECDRLSDGATTAVLREEAGALPMQAGYGVAKGPSQGYARIGLGGGAARPSTGYAFQRIQRMSDRLAAQIQSSSDTPWLDPRLDGAITRVLDRLFLRVIQSAPERGPEFFHALFANAPPERLERFLAGSVAAADRLSVIASLPPAFFLRSALRSS
ncbi:Lycopene beta cyclase [Salinisphaera sp. LB1]|nr:Lycopene beta cyclase [Salinisphaera sp. LB1]